MISVSSVRVVHSASPITPGLVEQKMVERWVLGCTLPTLAAVVQGEDTLEEGTMLQSL